MLRAIDRFVAAIRRGDGEEIVFATGQPIRVRHGAQMRVLLAQPVRSDQILAILMDVVPRDVDRGVTKDGDATFTFEAAGGPVVVHVRRQGQRIDAVLRPAPDPVASAAVVAAKPEAPPAPPPGMGPPPPVRGTPVVEENAGPAIQVIPAGGAAPPPEREETTAVNFSVGSRKQIDPMLHTLVKNKASDLHITATMQARMRKDGDIKLLPGFENNTLTSDQIRTMLMEVAPPLAREKFEKSNDADFAYEIPGLARFRVNAFKDRRGVSGVLRVIPSKILTAEELGLPPVVRELCGLHKGLVLVTGPTGSGKSTTLAAMIDLINKNRSDHIITIEDPVEFVHNTQGCLVNQREVHVDTMSFSAALRAALREDPDIVLVGEMRDLETIAIAIETAETGHLVFGTLHTTTAPSTIDRIIDQFPADRQSQIRVMLSESLRGVVAQTLCKKQGGGRVAALEILVCNTAVANLIREAKTFQIPSMMQTQKALGMQTLNDALFNLVKDGVVAPDEAFHRSVDRSGFKMMLDRANIKLGAH